MRRSLVAGPVLGAFQVKLRKVRTMRMVFGLVLVVGLAVAGFAVYMAQNYMADLQTQRDQLAAAQANAPQLVDVVVAKKAMKYGEKFMREDLDVVKWQADKVPEGAFHQIVAAQGGDPNNLPVFFEGETRPRAVLRSLEIFEPVLAKKVTEPGIDAGITANLTANMRALAINVDVSSGVSGFLRPNDHVDIYWSGDANGRRLAVGHDQIEMIQTMAVDPVQGPRHQAMHCERRDAEGPAGLRRVDRPLDRRLIVDGVDQDPEEILLAAIDHPATVSIHRSTFLSWISRRMPGTSYSNFQSG